MPSQLPHGLYLPQRRIALEYENLENTFGIFQVHYRNDLRSVFSSKLVSTHVCAKTFLEQKVTALMVCPS